MSSSARRPQRKLPCIVHRSECAEHRPIAQSGGCSRWLSKDGIGHDDEGRPTASVRQLREGGLQVRHRASAEASATSCQSQRALPQLVRHSHAPARYRGWPRSPRDADFGPELGDHLPGEASSRFAAQRRAETRASRRSRCRPGGREALHEPRCATGSPADRRTTIGVLEARRFSPPGLPVATATDCG